MIYVCEYDGQADDWRLQERAEALLLSFQKKCGSERQRVKLRQRIVARLLLDFALRKEYGCSLTDLALTIGAGGKPESTLRPDIHFNISHCDTACACMVGAYETGIDIEGKFLYRENLARRICTSGEWAVFQSLDAKERATQLHFLWSLKESCVKWDGRGLAYGMQRIDLGSCLPLAVRAGEGRMSGEWQPEQAGWSRSSAETGAKNDNVQRTCKLWIQNTEQYTLAVCCEKIPADGPYCIEETELLV